MASFSPSRLRLLLLIGTLCAALAITQVGCGRKKPDAAEDQAQQQAPKLSVLVVDDPQIAAAIRRAAGQWRTHTGGELTVQEATSDKLGQLEQFQADAVICAAAHIGTLAAEKKILPLSKQWLSQSSGHWAGVFDLLRIREVAWGEQIYAVPFGSPVLVCYYRADLLEKFGRKPPRTWAEYQQLAGFFADRKNLGDVAPSEDQPWSGTLEPLAPGWAGLMLLARAAPYIKHRNNFSTLFDIEMMEPLIGRQPWIRALEELVAATKTASHNTLEMDPAAVRAAFWQGQCAMAISWPTAAHATASHAVSAPSPGAAAAPDQTTQPDAAQKIAVQFAEAQKIAVGFVELPGSPEVFDVGSNRWMARAEDEDTHIPLLSVAGRVGVVSAASPQPEAAYRLLLWLSDEANSAQICAVSPYTTLFRHGHLQAPQLWVERGVSPHQAAQYAATVKTALMRQQWVDGLRIPGRTEYLGALDQAIHKAVRGEVASLEAMAQTMASWREITRRLGSKQQRLAYLRSLGLDELQ